MADIFTPAKRSEIMSRIKSRNTKPEMVVRKILFSKGLRYRLHEKDLPGKPDIVFRTSKLAVFVHGCFWLQHENCKDAFIPSTRQNYWLPKLEKNVQRDEKAIKCLNEMDWKVYIVWECLIKDDYKLNDLIDKIAASVEARRTV